MQTADSVPTGKFDSIFLFGDNFVEKVDPTE